jgi:uncharacterized low-complexity protein
VFCLINYNDNFHTFNNSNFKNYIMKLRKFLYVAALSILVAVFFSACSQSTNKTATDSTELAIEKGDQVTKCSGEAKCGEGKCGDGKEVADSTKKCGEAKEASDSTKKCGEGKCGA